MLPLHQIATWNNKRDLWESDQLDLISGRSAVYSGIWPTSGMTRSGRAFRLPPLVHRINVNGCSYWPTNRELINTPSTVMANKQRNDAGKGLDNNNLWLVVNRPNFGKYKPTFDLWAKLLGRPMPPVDCTLPTGRSLSPRWAEWLMGLPEGWVSDADIAYSRKIEALGNGVVPQQAAAALRLLVKLMCVHPSAPKVVGDRD